MIGNRLSACLVAGILVIATTASGLADNTSAPRPNDALPGVEGNYSIVKPAIPEPDQQSGDASTGRFKIGNTEIRIGGSVRVDIQAGSLSAQHR